MNIQPRNNVNSLNNVRQLNRIGNQQNRTNERLATGRRINRASDDAAGLAISEALFNQIRSLDQAIRNTHDGVSMVRTAEGAMNEVGDIMSRARELTVQAANDTLSPTARNAIYSEIAQVLDEVNSISRNTQFNTRNLLSQNQEVGLQTGANAGQRTNFNLSAMNTGSIGLGDFADRFRDAANAPTAQNNNSLTDILNNTDTSTLEGQMIADAINNTLNTTSLELNGVQHLAQTASSTGVPLGGATLSSMLDRLDAAINTVSGARAELGAVENRLNHTINRNSVANVNMAAANSRIRDADMAREMINAHQQSAQQQASLAMMAHNNLQIGAAARLLG